MVRESLSTLPALVLYEEMIGEHVLYCDGSLKRLSLHMASAEIQQAAVNCSCRCTLHDVMEITNGET